MAAVVVAEGSDMGMDMDMATATATVGRARVVVNNVVGFMRCSVPVVSVYCSVQREAHTAATMVGKYHELENDKQEMIFTRLQS